MLEVLLETIECGKVTTSKQMADMLGISEEMVKSQLIYLKNMGYVEAEAVKMPEPGPIGCSKNCPGCAMSKKNCRKK